MANELVRDGAGMSPEDEAALALDEGMTEVKLMHGVSPNVMQNDPIGIRAGDFLLLSGKRRIPCGKEGDGFRCVVGPSRPKAILKDGSTFKVTEESFDPKSKKWLEISARVPQKGRRAASGAPKGYIGFDVLLWLPDWNAIASIYLANQDRTDLAPKVFSIRQEKKLARFNTTIGGDKNMVKLQVAPISGPAEVGFPMPSSERWESAIAQFEAYKLEVPVQQDGTGPQR
jgi:hypothetical protein